MPSNTEFNAGSEAAFRRVIRNQIRKGPFTKGQRDVALAFFNHWFFHRTSTKKVVHPGRDKLARKAGVTIRTVTRTLDILRAHGAIIAVAHLEGLHGKATEYVVDIVAMTELCDLKKTDIRVNGGTNCTAVGRDTMSRRSCDVLPFPSHRIKSYGGGNV